MVVVVFAAGKSAKGVNGVVYNELVQLLTRCVSVVNRKTMSSLRVCRALVR